MAPNIGKSDEPFYELTAKEYVFLPLANSFPYNADQVLLDGPAYPYQTGATRSGFGFSIDICRANTAEVQMSPVQQIQASRTFLEQGDQKLPV
jgi:hypothetical protein